MARPCRRRCRLLALALPWVGHFQTRNRGTVCGSVAHADPSAEMPLCLVALGGEVRAAQRQRRRRVAAEDFFAGMMLTARADDELIEAVRFAARRPGDRLRLPRSRAAPWRFRHRRLRRHGRCRTASVSPSAASPTVPTARDWPRLEGSALDDALNAFAWELGARDDVHATARYRRDLVRLIGRDLIEEAAAMPRLNAQASATPSVSR